jgi:hypothetical protein
MGTTPGLPFEGSPLYAKGLSSLTSCTIREEIFRELPRY